MQKFAARPNANTISISAVPKSGYKAWLEKAPKTVQAWLSATSFVPEAGEVALCPARDGSLSHVVLGLGQNNDPWAYASLAEHLPRGRYALKTKCDNPTDAAIAYALGTYEFTRYRKPRQRFATLVWPDGADQDHVTRVMNAVTLGRDLVNTPAGDLGPAELCDALVEVGKLHGAKTKVLKGKQLLEQNYPTIHAVGRAASRPPHLADLRWGDPKHPRVTLVGKGVVFDSGGLDLKSAAGMKLMKKDMGGGASVIALASMIMDAKLPVQLRVLLPAVENAVSGDAYRPLDVITTRKGLTVEVGNTDAEGRLILCDALAEADSEKPALLIDFATLTGAARVALGTELPALFSSDDDLANDVLAAGSDRFDALWRLPLHEPYRRFLESRVADLSNIGSVPQGGAITAALFLSSFISRRTKWMHVDTMAYNAHALPGRPAGGEVFGVRGVFEALRRRFA